MLEEIKKELLVLENLSFLEFKKVKPKVKLLTIHKSYSFSPINYNLTTPNLLNLNNLDIICFLDIFHSRRKFFSVKVSFSCSFDHFLHHLNDILQGDFENSFISICNVIYTKDKDKLKEFIMDYDLMQRYNAFIRFESLYNDLKSANINIFSEIMFFDGRNKCYDLKIKDLCTSHTIPTNSFLVLKNNMSNYGLCKGCSSALATIETINDPILPLRKNKLCRKCFELLFLFDDKLKYKGMSYKELK